MLVEQRFRRLHFIGKRNIAPDPDILECDSHLLDFIGIVYHQLITLWNSKSRFHIISNLYPCKLVDE